ncbi:hypothetical protein GALMADRAFT_228344 [Galerina marginata CBS 339.88]|uniref:F-box domain-containing protein n=1 Tax=Galerina marginata (strain CBS 339.88) TaxID=685588 RepID=A0A067ST57_GALM3|nr:hypothetical protein GALMADRAFT_228344 [Galerina marginata CBS 339.88]
MPTDILQQMSKENPIPAEDSMVQTKTDSPLPLELAIIILGHVEDITVLANCGLVCHDWLSLTRHKVFTNLRLSERMQKALIARFPDLLSNPLSTIPSNVTSLAIVDPVHNASQSVLPLLAPLTTVKTLEVANQSPFFTPGRIPMAIATQYFTHVNKLKVEADFPDFPHMISFICAFRSLESLDLDANWEGPGSIVSYRPSPTLRVLRIRSYAKFTLQWLVSLGRELIPPLEDLTLTIAEKGNDDFSGMNHLLRVLGPAVRCLTCDLRDYTPDNNPSVINLRFSTALEHLKIISFVRILMTCNISPAQRQIQLKTFSSFNPRIMSFRDIDTVLSTLPTPPVVAPSSNSGSVNTVDFPLTQQRGFTCLLHEAGDDVEQFFR